MSKDINMDDINRIASKIHDAIEYNFDINLDCDTSDKLYDEICDILYDELNPSDYPSYN